MIFQILYRLYPRFFYFVNDMLRKIVYHEYVYLRKEGKFMKKFTTFQKIKKLLLGICISGTVFLSNTATLLATEAVDYTILQQERLSLPIQSNEIENWPDGPEVGAEGAIVMEANTGTILYAKNIDEKLYPASTTKILTTLVAQEHASLDEIVSFSYDAVFGIERDSSNMGMDVGQEITMEQCLYGILVYSANEVCNAVAEHISGNQDDYVKLMNEKAKELGCENSHFVTTNGLHNEEHYTTPRDLATIARAFFSNETLSKISGTAHYVIEPTEKQPDFIDLYTHNKLLNKTYPYAYLVGSKTGYTTQARQTLVSCAEKDGMKLICVVMKEESPSQFTDTIALFDYGFNNFHKVNVAENETKYTVDSTDFFDTDNDIFGSSDPIISINSADCVVIPNTVDFSDIESTLTYDSKESSTIATIHYSYHNIPVGTATVNLATSQNTSYDFDGPVAVQKHNNPNEITENVIFINVLKIIMIAFILIVLFIFLIVMRSFLKSYHFNFKRRRFTKSTPLNFNMSHKKFKKRRNHKTPKYKNRDYYNDIHFK